VDNIDFTSSDSDQLGISEVDWQNQLLKDCEEFLQRSEAKRKNVPKKSRKQKRKDLANTISSKKRQTRKTYMEQTEGIDESEF
jgi:secreted Zn-dependent insulinase-like peptidase